MSSLSRAEWHGRRLADEGRALTDDLIGYLAWHEGSDASVQTMSEFALRLRSAYDARRREMAVTP